MRITVNGEQRELDAPTTIDGLLQSLGISVGTTVVQRNDDVVARARYSETELSDGDNLELVRFVGGG
jgi:thiamine biosynthesis protein ThiS